MALKGELYSLMEDVHWTYPECGHCDWASTVRHAQGKNIYTCVEIALSEIFYWGKMYRCMSVDISGWEDSESMICQGTFTVVLIMMICRITTV